MIWEPLNLDHVPEAREAGFEWRTVIHPDASTPSAHQFMSNVLAGRVLNEWTCSRSGILELALAKTLVVKLVRGNLLLPWIIAQFRVRTPVLLVRHPCAVVASQLRYGVWGEADPTQLRSVLAAYPQYEDYLRSLRSPEERLAAQWALDNLALTMPREQRSWTTVSFEQLVCRGRLELHRLLPSFGFDNVEPAIRRLSVISSSALPRSTVATRPNPLDGWRVSLARDEVREVLKVVEHFGIDVYSDALEPDYERL